MEQNTLVRRDRSARRSKPNSEAVVLAFTLDLLLGWGCASYEPKPLSVRELSSAIDGRASNPLPIAPSDIPETKSRGRAFDLRDGWSLYELEIVALYQNPDLKMAWDDLHVAQGLLIAAGKLPNPVIADSTVLAPLGAGTASFALNVVEPILTAGKRRIAREGAASEQTRAEAAVESQEWKVTREVAERYWRLRYADERLRLEGENIALAERSLAIAQARLEVEDAAPLDVDLASSELATRQSRLQTLLSDKTSETYELARLLGLPPSTEFRWEVPEDLYGSRSMNLSAQELEDLALDGRADLREARARYAVAEKALELAVAGANPDVDLGPGFEKSGGEPSRAGLFVSFPIPIFNQNQGPIAQRQAERERAAHEVESRLLLAKQEIHAALSRFAALEHAVALYRVEVLPKLESAVERSQAAYEAGQVGAVELVSVQQSLARTRTDLLDLLSSRQTALIELERAAGSEFSRDR
jgi:cobalt-zinc-cadmium efflux system outer membrane protein